MTFSQISRVLLMQEDITAHRRGIARFLRRVDVTGIMNRKEIPKRKKLITEKICDYIYMVSIISIYSHIFGWGQGVTWATNASKKHPLLLFTYRS